jgi:hypothetical protein
MYKIKIKKAFIIISLKTFSSVLLLSHLRPKYSPRRPDDLPLGRETQLHTHTKQQTELEIVM